MMRSSDEVVEASPKSGSSWNGPGGGGGGGTQRRRKLSSEDVTDDMEQQNGGGTGGSSSARKDRKSRRNRKNGKSKSSSFSGSDTAGGSGGGGSVLWTVLVIGLVFCVVDVVYIMGFVDRQHELFHLSGSIMHPELRWKQHKQQQQQEQHTDGGGGGGSQQQQAIPNSNEGGDSSSTTTGDEADFVRPNSLEELIHDKQHLIDLITHAKVDGFSPDTPITSLASLTDSQISLLQDLPTWSEVKSMYYSNSVDDNGNAKPIVYGLELCEPFQNHSPRWDHFVSTAGTFNTGTNFMAELLIANCHMQDRMDHYGAKNRGVRWQVPWGKHTPPGDEEFRLSHKTHNDANVNASDILPAVTIRDPLVWLQSMCRHEYAAHWKHDKEHCPNFEISEENPDLSNEVHYAEFTRHHDSILHLWNDYYNEYLNVPFHRLIVRFEDLIFFPEQVTETVCKCAGGSMNLNGVFKYVVDSAKKGAAAHGKVRTGYVDAIIKYGSAKNRYKGYKTVQDLQYITDHVDPNLMNIFHYLYPDLNALQQQ